MIGVSIVLGSLSLCHLNLGCGKDQTETSSGQEGAVSWAELHALAETNAVLQKENQLKAEQLAVHNAKIPGGLALGEREKQMDQREARLAQAEEALQLRESSVLEKERGIEEDRQELAVARQKFVVEREEMVQKIGEAKQIIARYEEVVREKNDALVAERQANLRVMAFVKYSILAGSGVCICGLLTILYFLRHRARQRDLDFAMTVRASHYAEIPSEPREPLGTRFGGNLPL